MYRRCSWSIISGERKNTKGCVLLQPERWLGKPCPLLRHIEIGDQLVRGEWIVFFYHYGCPMCEELIPTYLQRARDMAAQNNSAKVALVQLSPQREAPAPLALDGAPCLAGNVSQVREWVVSTPIELRFAAGIVKKVTPAEKLTTTRGELRGSSD